MIAGGFLLVLYLVVDYLYYQEQGSQIRGQYYQQAVRGEQ